MVQPVPRDSRGTNEVRYSLWGCLSAEIPYCTYRVADILVWYGEVAFDRCQWQRDDQEVLLLAPKIGLVRAVQISRDRQDYHRTPVTIKA